ncbi:MAG TPA: HAMP domain-containing sensor histidine kinase [Verrucomicrobiae bacterium]|nr:HAMP domain-containing sensor histidine kinase [Verrucomicrobiae bacterium]
MQAVLRYSYDLFLAPRSLSDDMRRREFILNVLLTSLALVTCLLFVFSVLHALDLQIDQQEGLATLYALGLSVVFGLWRLSRNSKQQLASLGLLLLLYVAATRLTIHYSFELPISELMYAVLIVFAGILLKTHDALVTAGIVVATLLGVSYVQTAHYMTPRLDWLNQDFGLGDAIGYMAMLCLIALVSWLANRDIHRSLARAQDSEAALVKERDELEVKVAERTQELEQTQLLRTIELERFANLGRVSAHLLHELVNPLTAASLHLNQFMDQQSPLIAETRQSLWQMERYIKAARRQLDMKSQLNMFSVRAELNLVLRIMRPLARRNNITLTAKVNTAPALFGDPVKFNQLATNLLANSLDACAEARHGSTQGQVQIIVNANGQWLKIQVIDNGEGIKESQLPFIFEHFYSTKVNGRGTGLGLPLVKKIAEEDFQGNVTVTSMPGEGTVFTVRLLLPEKT